MRLISRPLPGMLVLQAEPRVDQRGYFARCFCRTELAQWGVTAPIEQANLSFSERALTLRGLHYQVGPSRDQGRHLPAGHAPRRRPRPAGGFADLRRARGRGTLRHQQAIAGDPARLRPRVHDPRERHAPAHMVSSAYDPTRERAVRWDDPGFAIEWPDQPRATSPRDAAIPDFDPSHHLAA